MEALSLLDNFDFEPAIKAALSDGFQSEFQRLQETSAALERRIQHDGFIIEKLKLELAYLRRLRFGQRSEVTKGLQLDLFSDAVSEDIGHVEAALESHTSAASGLTEKKARKPRARAGRQPLPPHLPRIDHVHDLGVCPCGQCGESLIKIGEDVTEQLDVEPAKFIVHRHIRPKYTCRTCETVTAVPVAASLIEGGMASPGLLAWVLVSKFADHLPLYRIEQISARNGVTLAQSTLGDWVGRSGFHLTPLWEQLKSHLLKRSVIHADESPVRQLCPGKGKTHQSYLWAYRSNILDQGPPIVVFDYQTGRAGQHARDFLGQWRGSLCVDDFVGYDALFKTAADNPVACIEVGCMVHARRKFFDLFKADQNRMAAKALCYIRKLYKIEAAAKDMSVEDRQVLRLGLAVPVLKAYHRFLEESLRKSAPSGASVKAINYSLKRWDALSRYATTGDLPIDNSPAERSIRPIAIGRKNWMFVGSERAGKRAAIIQSLIGTAKLNGIDPSAWLKNTLECIPIWPTSRIDELLPLPGWKPRTLER